MTVDSSVVLVVDDDQDVRDFLSVELGRAGIASITAANGRQAIELFKTARPIAVLMDVMMPGMDGFQVLSELRQLELGRDTPVIFITALADSSTAARAASVGADDLLNKPVAPAELKTRVQMAIALARARREITSCHTVMRSQLTAIEEAKSRRRLVTSLLVHDMKNPLTALKGDLESVLADRALGGDTREAVQDASEAADRLLAMVLNVLDIEISDDGQLSPRMAALDLKPILESVVQAFGHASSIRSVKLRFLSKVPHAEIKGDRDLIRRMFANLLDNAINNSKPHTEVLVILESVGGQFMARVQDQGPGIPDEAKEAVFDRFVRLSDSSRKNNYGLGLTSCKLACDAHGARIWVSDNEPRGASFNVQFAAPEEN